MTQNGSQCATNKGSFFTTSWFQPSSWEALPQEPVKLPQLGLSLWRQMGEGQKRERFVMLSGGQPEDEQ